MELHFSPRRRDFTLTSMCTHSEQASVSSADLLWSQDIIAVKCNQPLSVFSLFLRVVMVALFLLLG